MFAFVGDEVEEIEIPLMFEENQQRRQSVFLPDAMGTLLAFSHESPLEMIQSEMLKIVVHQDLWTEEIEQWNWCLIACRLCVFVDIYIHVYICIYIYMDSSYSETTECDSFITTTSSNLDIL